MAQFPHLTKKKVALFDRMVVVTSLVAPIMTIPQVVQIWSTQNAQGVSLYTWGTYFIGSLIWITYGIIHKEKPILYSYSLFFIVNGLVVLGVLLFQ
jgi:uncharacterized protein with PQ loop repeat